MCLSHLIRIPQAAQEVRDTEQSYVQSLWHLNTVFIEPLRFQARTAVPVLPGADVEVQLPFRTLTLTLTLTLSRGGAVRSRQARGRRARVLLGRWINGKGVVHAFFCFFVFYFFFRAGITNCLF